MPLGKQRDKVVLGLGKARGKPHRYSNWRWAVAIAFTLAIAALPFFGIIRFDLWGGHHHYLGEQLGLVEVARRFAFPFLGVNLAIILVSRFFGRYLCGFVCPYGAVARFAEWLRFRAKTRKDRIIGGALLITTCSVLSAITFSFWLDWRVFSDASAPWKIVASMFLLGMITSFYVFVQKLGLGFCRNWCPSGVYFALLGHDTNNGIEFAHPQNCTDCKACEKACPMDLLPRELSGGKYREGSGFYPDGMSNFALCIRCGDCVSACEGTTARLNVATPLRMGFLPSGARDSAAPEHGELKG
ncbi:MAG: 4Fe-4S binding protein [Planctomycetes bacterium]|nr:4Fe-4S binding protein [Planctomycetota bacterium]